MHYFQQPGIVTPRHIRTPGITHKTQNPSPHIHTHRHTYNTSHPSKIVAIPRLTRRRNNRCEGSVLMARWPVGRGRPADPHTSRPVEEKQNYPPSWLSSACPGGEAGGRADDSLMVLQADEPTDWLNGHEPDAVTR